MIKSDKIMCPYCEEEITPDRRVSMGGAVFFTGLYILYYYWIKKHRCPACDRGLTVSDMKGYNDPDKQWKILSAIPIILFILIMLLAMFL